MEPNLPAHPLSAGAAEAPAGAVRDGARAGLYVHVPFCAARCSYCDFSSGSPSGGAVDRYVAALELEIERRSAAAQSTRFHSVFFGGGTPSVLSPSQFRRVWKRLGGAFDIAPLAEVTLEANPESVHPARLEAWAAAGVNRLSMGAQSFHADELERLGRIHAPLRPALAMALAREHGFRRLSLDLMFGFPGHDWARFEASLEAALDCGIEHLSAYCFIPERGTALGDAVLDGHCALPPAEEQAELYERLTDRLERVGFAGYETSNFCRGGAEARHNLVYWLRRPYLGLGPSAHSLLGGERFANHYAFARWAGALERGRSPECERERESPAAVAEEIVMLGLRLGSGCERRDHVARDWAHVSERYGEALDRAVTAGRLERTASGWRVPRSLRFVADEAIAWVLAREKQPRESLRSFDLRGTPTIMIEPCSSLPSPAI